LSGILQVKNLKKYYTKKNIFGKQTSLIKAVDGVSFSVELGQTLVLAGESGSGKSTVAKMILHAIEPDSGEIIFDGTKISGDPSSLQKIRMGVQMVYQDPYDSINPNMKIRDIIAEPLEIHRIGNTKQRLDMVRQVLHEVKMVPADEFMTKYPHMLSGGQRQRIVLARALILKPKMIIADEPVSMLDVSIRAEILELMDALREKLHISFLYITHDLATARYFGQKIAILHLGKIVEVGPIDEVLFSPNQEYTKALIGAISDPDPDNLTRKRKIQSSS
jgi:peptide/nickel transport system ATP-binding protein